jgi:ABC-type nitrate/sulfonate/bicarbonate transport system permease component
MLTALPGVGALMMQARRDFQSAQVSPLRAMVGLLALVVNGFGILEASVLRRRPGTDISSKRH